MNGWATVWAILFGVSLTIFGLLAVAVTIGGLRDVWEMFRRIDTSHEKNGSATGTGGDPDDA